MHARRSSFLYPLASMALCALLGCSHDIIVPGSAKVVAGGDGRLRYVAEENGDVFLIDSATKKPVFHSLIARGDTMDVDPQHDRIDVAGTPAEHKTPLNVEHVYRIYFDRAR